MGAYWQSYICMSALTRLLDLLTDDIQHLPFFKNISPSMSSRFIHVYHIYSRRVQLLIKCIICCTCIKHKLSSNTIPSPTMHTVQFLLGLTTSNVSSLIVWSVALDYTSVKISLLGLFICAVTLCYNPVNMSLLEMLICSWTFEYSQVYSQPLQSICNLMGLQYLYSKSLANWQLAGDRLFTVAPLVQYSSIGMWNGYDRYVERGE